MAALFVGNNRCVSTRIRELEARARESIRRGLCLSGTLHIVLLVLFLGLTRGGGDSLAPSYHTPAVLLPPRLIDFVSPPSSASRHPVATKKGGLIQPVRDFNLPPELPAFNPTVKGVDDPRGREMDPGSEGTDRPEVRTGSPPDPQVYRVEEVDELPVPIEAPRPAYPEWPREVGMTGRVVLRLLVGADGRVEDVRVMEGSRYFIDAARDALRRWRFTPAKFHGRAVPVWVEVPVQFRL